MLQSWAAWLTSKASDRSGLNGVAALLEGRPLVVEIVESRDRIEALIYWSRG